jgi:hypothetical protein
VLRHAFQLLPIDWRSLLAAALIFWFAYGSIFSPREGRLIAIPLLILALACSIRPAIRLLRLAHRVRQFRTLRSDAVILHYSPDLLDWADLPALVRQAEREMARLQEWFGLPLRRRPTIYLFASHSDMAHLLGPGYGGAALIGPTTILIAADNWLTESLRHELAHLFAARWRPGVPPLLEEGLAVYLQRTNAGRPIEDVYPFLFRSVPLIPPLMERNSFFTELDRSANYALAGSFVAFLIRRYGRDRFERLYRSLNAAEFWKSFPKHLGITLQDAEAAWRRTLADSALYDWLTEDKPHPRTTRPPLIATGPTLSVRRALFIGIPVALATPLPLWALVAWEDPHSAVSFAPGGLIMGPVIALMVVMAVAFLSLYDAARRRLASGNPVSLPTRLFFTNGFVTALALIFIILVFAIFLALVVSRLPL